MDKKLDFASELSAVTANVDAEVGDVLRAISQQKKEREVKLVEVAATADEKVSEKLVENQVRSSPSPRTNIRPRRPSINS